MSDHREQIISDIQDLSEIAGGLIAIQLQLTGNQQNLHHTLETAVLSIRTMCSKMRDRIEENT